MGAQSGPDLLTINPVDGTHECIPDGLWGQLFFHGFFRNFPQSWRGDLRGRCTLAQLFSYELDGDLKEPWRALQKREILDELSSPQLVFPSEGSNLGAAGPSRHALRLGVGKREKAAIRIPARKKGGGEVSWSLRGRRAVHQNRNLSHRHDGKERKSSRTRCPSRKSIPNHA